jgi:hypothetical protein
VTREKKKNPSQTRDDRDVVVFVVVYHSAAGGLFSKRENSNHSNPPKKHGGKKKDVTQVASLSSPFFLKTFPFRTGMDSWLASSQSPVSRKAALVGSDCRVI